MVAIASPLARTAPLDGSRGRSRSDVVVPLVPVPDRGRTPLVAGGRALATLALVAVALLSAMSLAMSPPVSATGAPATAGTHVASEGESMWSIATDHAPAGEAAGYVERLVELNGGADVTAGQVVTLPLP